MKSPAHAKAPPPPYPLFLDLSGVRVLVVGGGAVAARKLSGLLESHARATVVAPVFSREMLSIDRKSRRSTFPVTLVKRRFKPGDLRGAKLIFAATDDPNLNARICHAARAKGLLANCAAPPEEGNFAVPATVRRGAFCIAISTGGTSAALAAEWRKRLEKLAGDELRLLTSLLWKKRVEIKAQISDAQVRREMLAELGQPKWAAKIKQRGLRAVERDMDALIAKAGEISRSASS